MRRPPLTFHSRRSGPAARPLLLRAIGGEGRIELQGALSAGSVGWQLGATARQRRRVINVYVTAKQTGERRMPDVEDHDYVGVIELPPGLYHVRINHVYLLDEAPGSTMGLLVYERTVRVS